MKQLGQRLLQMLVTVLGVSFLTFCLTYLAPGDPAMMVLEAGDTIVSQELIEKTRHEMGLDQPFLVQYVNWVGGAVHGDMGMSYSAKKPVTEKLAEGFTGTLFLAAVTVVFILLISIPLGIFSAVHQNKLPDYLVRFFSFIGVSMPSFWVGLILLYIFGLKLRLFPIASSEVTLNGVILPAITLAIYQSAKYTRQVRTVILEELHQDYVVGARARGLTESVILWKHVLEFLVIGFDCTHSIINNRSNFRLMRCCRDLIPTGILRYEEYVILKFEKDEDGEDILVTIDDDDEFDRIADIFDDMFSDILYDEPAEE